MVGYPPFLRRLFVLGVAISIAGGLGRASASPLTVAKPQNIFDVMQTTEILTTNLDEAQCGGWNFGESVDGKIPRVTGAPGRQGIVFEDGSMKPEVLNSGMAWRDESSGTKEDGFIFPDRDHVNGWSTVCDPNTCGGSFPYKQDIPFGPPCTNPGECDQMCQDLNRWQRRHMICVAKWTETIEVGEDEEGNILYEDIPYEDWFEGTSPCYKVSLDDPFATEEWCYPEDEWKPINEVLQEDHPDAAVTCEPAVDDEGNVTGEWAIDEMLYCCSDAKVEDRDSDPTRNCIACQGDGLEYPQGSQEDYNHDFIPDLAQTGCRKGKVADPGNGREYFSYFREYFVSYERDNVSNVPDDDTQRMDIPVDCYGLYDDRNEFDPKFERTTSLDRHCVINLSDPRKRFDRMPETQRGKGEYGADYRPADPPFEPIQRDTQNDLWITDMGDAFSLINGEKLERSFGKDIPFSLLNLDIADLRATVQMTPEKPLSEAGLIRATDDTVSNDNPGRRIFSEWWQEQETMLHRVFTPPVIRLILPTPWSIGLSVNDPLLNPSPKTQKDAPIHLQEIDVQLRTTQEDLLGEVSSYLEHAMLLRIEEESIPVLVPLASPVELRSLAQSWKTWGEHQPDGKAQAEAIAEKLNGYAERIDDVRALRAELARYIGKVLKFQQEMTVSIAEWLKNNTNTFEEYARAWDARLSLKSIWQEVQQGFRRFHDRANTPWCRNDRFTTPIYSLLDLYDSNDTWYPGRASPRDLALDIDSFPANSDDGYMLPRISVDRLPDLVYNFSAIRVSTGTVKLPVLKPIQVRLDQPYLSAPGFYTKPEDIQEKLQYLSSLPDLPPVPSLFQRITDQYLPREVLKPDSPASLSTNIPEVSDSIARVLERMLLLTGEEEAYQKFWDSIMQTDTWDCNEFDTVPCVHTEMDLLERFTRIGARPAIELKEDIESRGYFRGDIARHPQLGENLPSLTNENLPSFLPPCPREDWVCQMFNGERTMPIDGWRVEGMDPGISDDELNALKGDMAEETLPKNGQNVPYIVKPNEMLPSFNVPAPISLSPLSTHTPSASP